MYSTPRHADERGVGNRADKSSESDERGTPGSDPRAVAPDFSALAEALLLASPDEDASLRVLRERLAEYDPRPNEHAAEAEAEEAADVVRGAIELVDRLARGECESESAAMDDLGQAVLRLTEIKTGPRSKADAAPSEETSATSQDLTAEAACDALENDTELLAEFVERAFEYLESADDLLLGLQEDPSDGESIAAVFRAFHTIKGMAGFLGLANVEMSAHDAEDLLGDVRGGKAALDSPTLDALFAAVDAVKALVKIAAVGAPAAAWGSTDDSGPAQTPSAAARTTVRVDEERLDQLVDTIGELVIAQASVGQSARGLTDIPEALAAQLARLDKISRQLQQMATSMRMVSLRPTLRRMARLVRDLAHDSGKHVDCVLIGEDIELDKTIVDSIGDPLIHLVRNAVDHGIEDDPAARRRAGKPETASVTISVRHLGGSTVIDVADDGRGLDREAIARRARETGLLAQNEIPAADAVPLFIFEPGFSTAGRVTAVSGRGVGMDVVKREVDALRGTIGIDSEPGQGTTISMTLPITLAIIDGMVVRVGTERYIVPALSVVRTVCVEPSDVTVVLGKGETITTAYGIVPLLRLRQLFDITQEDEAEADRLVTLVSDGSAMTGLVVSELLGQQQIVIKGLGTGLGDVPGVSGAAIMPDGRIGLILDIHGIVRLARRREG
jgi:two-component system, chemotaxis family, sensor kinase CheA